MTRDLGRFFEGSFGEENLGWVVGESFDGEKWVEGMEIAIILKMFHIFYIVRCAWAKIFIGVSIVIAATVASGSGGQRVELGWDAPTDSEVVGYRLKYGTASGSYDQEVNVTGVTVGTAENLAAGTPYYFVVTSYNQDMAESLPSEELVVTTGANPLPVISLIIPGNSYGWTSPASITLKASASAGVGTSQRVEFYNGAE